MGQNIVELYQLHSAPFSGQIPWPLPQYIPGGPRSETLEPVLAPRVLEMACFCHVRLGNLIVVHFFDT